MVLFLIVCRVFQFFFLNCELFLYVHFFFLVVSVLSSEALMFPKDVSVLFVPQSRHLVNTTWKCSLGSEFQRCARRSCGDNVGEIQTYLILLEQCRFSLCTEVHGQPTHPHGGGSLMGSHGRSQLVLCPHPSTLPSNIWKTHSRSGDLCN